MNNHMFDVAFSIDSDKDWEEISAEELLEALQKRIDYLKNHEDEVLDACQIVDSVQFEEDVIY